jgi:hypothetical protein
MAVSRFGKQDQQMTQCKPAKSISEIDSAFATNIDTNETQELSVREGSYCHFFVPFEVAGHIVKLRLDWKDLDEQGRPTLDADFYDARSNKKLKNSGDRRPAHRTKSTSQFGRIYEWEFKTENLRLKVVLHCTVALHDNLEATDVVVVDVYRNGKKID